MAILLKHTHIDRIVALRGDSTLDRQCYAFESTVDFIHSLKQIHDFDISIAAYPEVHPQASSADDDLKHLKAKFDAGASRAITQFFFDVETFLRFRDRAQAIGIDKPIIPGILPILDYNKVTKFAKSCGTSLPDYLAPAFGKCEGNMKRCNLKGAADEAGIKLADFDRGYTSFLLDKVDSTKFSSL